MAKVFTKIEGNTVQANMLRAFVQQQRAAYELGVRLRAIMSNSNDGSDFTDISTLFGVPTNKAQSVYDLINGTIGAMEGTFQNSNGKSLGELIG